MASLWRQLQLMAFAESHPAHFRVSPTGVRPILPCTVKLQSGVNKVRKEERLCSEPNLETLCSEQGRWAARQSW